jgi:hypothetical protein
MPPYVKTDYFLALAKTDMMTYQLDENVQHSGLSSDSLMIYFSLVSLETKLRGFSESNFRLF